MKRIGIILQYTECDKYIYETVRELSESNKVQLFFLLNKESATNGGILAKIKRRIRSAGFFRAIEIAFFKLLTIVEFKILGIFLKDLREHHMVCNIHDLSKNEITYLNPLFSASGLVVSYPEEDIHKIKSLQLDILIRGNAPGIFKGNILKSAKEGMLSFHHGDNRWNRGGPPAFWEVYSRKPSTGFIIQKLTEELDGGDVLFRGSIATKRSYTENLVSLFNKSNKSMAQLILNYAANNKLPEIEQPFPYTGTILKIPSLIQSLSYVWQTCSLFFFSIMRKVILRKEYRWGVAFTSGSWKNAMLRKGIRIKNSPDHFFADPFVVTKDQSTICLVEDYSYKQKRGCITAIEITGKQYKIIGPVVQEPFHMSFPYVFEFEETLYMVPETAEANAIRLYKCVDFPMKWEYQKDVMANVKAVDTMIFKYEGQWWLFTNAYDDDAATLLAFYSDNPLSGTWTAHKQNPLIFDSNRARNGGILGNGVEIIRSRQKQDFNMYGASLTLAKITSLSPTTFAEEEIGAILPEFFPKLKGCHHIHSNEKYTVYDFVRTETLR